MTAGLFCACKWRQARTPSKEKAHRPEGQRANSGGRFAPVIRWEEKEEAHSGHALGFGGALGDHHIKRYRALCEVAHGRHVLDRHAIDGDLAHTSGADAKKFGKRRVPAALLVKPSF